MSENESTSFVNAHYSLPPTVFVFDSPSLSHNPTFHTHQSRIAHLISELGLTYHRSSSNAESLCSLLHLSTPDSGVVTNDTDAFAYGCERTFKNVTCETINREKNLCVKLPEGWGRGYVQFNLSNYIRLF